MIIYISSENAKYLLLKNILPFILRNFNSNTRSDIPNSHYSGNSGEQLSEREQDERLVDSVYTFLHFKRRLLFIFNII